MTDASLKDLKRPPEPSKRPKRHWFWGALFSSLMWAVVLAILGVGIWLYFDGAALKLVFPDPKPAPPTAVFWDDAQLGVLADPFLVCEQRMGQLLRLRGCHREQTPVNGAEIVCALEAPLESLRFGCGPYPDVAPAERLEVVAKGEEGWAWLLARMQEKFGDCRPQAVGPAVSEGMRWPKDAGDVACFWFGGFGSRVEPGNKATHDAKLFMAGFWIAYAPVPMSGYTANAWRHSDSVPQPIPSDPWKPLALRLDSAGFHHGLSAEERAEYIHNVFTKLFDRPGYVRPNISLEMEAYLNKHPAQ